MQLKPCPFCGVEMHIKSNRDTHKVLGDHADNCIFDLDDATAEYFATDDALGHLIENWNRRAQLAAAPAPPPAPLTRKVKDTGSPLAIVPTLGVIWLAALILDHFFDIRGLQ
jgi:hypothetical protein